MSCTLNGQIVQLRRERPMKDAKIRRFDAVGVTEPEITPKQLEELECGCPHRGQKHTGRHCRCRD